MSETAAEPHVNGTNPAPTPAADEQPCADCATPGEKIMAVVAFLLGAFVVVLAIDMFTGGKVTGYVQDKVPQ